MSVAIMVVDNASGEVLARVASPDYFDERRAGQVDLTQAVRSPGSALKPFIYGLGFEDGLIHPETLIEDRPIRYGSYAPENFDLTFQGTVTVRRALQLSLNVPAVAVLEEVGTEPARPRGSPRRARRSCCRGARRLVSRSGLGGVGVRLSDLTMLYAGFARRHTCSRSPSASDAPRLPAKRAARAGRRLVRRQHPARHAAAGERRRRAHRLQDRHELRLSRRLGGRLRRQAHHRRVGRTARRRAGARTCRAHRRRPDPVRRLRPRTGNSLRRFRRRRQARFVTTTAKLPPPLQRFQPQRIAAASFTRPLHIVFPPNGASLSSLFRRGAGSPPRQDRRRHACL